MGVLTKDQRILGGWVSLFSLGKVYFDVDIRPIELFL